EEPLPRRFHDADTLAPIRPARSGPATLPRPEGSASACPGPEASSREKRYGQDRSQSCDHARVHRVQAAELPDDEVEAEHARPRRVPQVLPLVRHPHAAQGDPVGDMADARSERHPAVRPQSQPAPADEPRRRGNFVMESWAELKKVEWPGQNQVIQGTVVVLIACLVVGTYL